MQVQEVMSKDVKVMSPEENLREAARAMRDGDFGVVPVGENDRLVGMLTDRDIAVRAVAEGRNPDSTKIREIMSDHVYYCFDDQTLEEAEQYMSEKQVRRLPVVNREKRLVGMLALADMARTSKGIRPAAEALSDISR